MRTRRIWCVPVGVLALTMVSAGLLAQAPPPEKPAAEPPKLDPSYIASAPISAMQIRGLAISIATAAFWGAYLLAMLTFLRLIDTFGRPATFWLYGVRGVAAWIFGYLFVPETKGRSLGAIEAHWRAGQHPPATRALSGRERKARTMHAWLIVMLLGVFLVGCGGTMSGALGPAPAASNSGMMLSQGDLDPTLAARIGAIAGELVSSGQVVGLAVGVHDRGREQRFTFGEVVHGSGTLPTAATEFEVGSVTKTFTAMLFALFVQRGLVHFDDPRQQ